MDKPYISIPTYDAGIWTYTEFSTREEYRLFAESIFKQPGQYGFDKTAFLFNEHARKFNKDNLYCESPELSKDFIAFWDTEKEKCRKGVIFKNGKGGVWHLTRFYYHWINFLRIYRKAPPKGFHFADVRDVQYHISLYELCAELNNKDEAELKKRQIAWSYLHIAKMYNYYIFESGFVGKIMASDKKYINATHGDWKFLEEYHNFTNMHTAWACSNMPHKEFSWQQKVETKTADGRKVQIGTKATITGISLDKDPVAGVGGASDYVLYEEGGIAPTAHITHGYMAPAMREGAIKTGTFTIGGSVGDLDQCEPLKDMIMNPEAHDIYPVWSNLLDANGTEGWSGLFIPEQWGYAGDNEESNCIDQYGNSLVEKAVIYLEKLYTDIKKKKTPEEYQLAVSQGPRNIEEAFAIRKLSIFPVRHTSKQLRRIADKEYLIEYVDIERTDENKFILKESHKKPNIYPTEKTLEDKRGVVCILERPGDNPKWHEHLASIDPIETGSTKSSESMASIYVWKNAIEVTRTNSKGQIETFIEGGKIVAWWSGRFDDPNETNEQLSKIVEYYNAKVTLEKNKPGFISYMQLKKRQHYLAHITDMVFDKEYENKEDTFKAYGWYNTPALWMKILEYGINSLSEELRTTYKEDGTVDKVIYGVERIPDPELLKEMQNYTDKGNFDRVIAYCALMAFVYRHRTVYGIGKKVVQQKDIKDTGKINRTLVRSAFHNIGGSGSAAMSRMKRSPFNNIK